MIATIEETDRNGARMSTTETHDAAPITPEFLAAGRAIFTVANPSGEHYTFRFVRSEPSGDYTRPAYWAQLLTGPDNESDYTYVGRFDASGGSVVRTKGSQLADDSRPLRVLRWVVAIVYGRATLPQGYRIHHEGRCGRCGRMLTTPTSYERGIGPECLRKMKGE